MIPRPVAGPLSAVRARNSYLRRCPRSRRAPTMASGPWAPGPGTRGKETAMGTGKEQAELWGPGARDWSDYNEPMCTPFYETVLDATGVRHGTKLLDVGCGGGFALLLAAARGATVSGLDATPALLDIARERVPDAVLAVGDLEDPMPFEVGAFDVVTAFNSVQYAGDPVAVVKNISQLIRPGGLISLLVWGPPGQCESAVLFKELGALIP